MKFTENTPAALVFKTHFFFITTPRYTLTIKLFFIFVFAKTLACTAQTEPAEFYSKINSRVLTDSTVKLFVSSIQIDGNKKTKDYIIEREMRLKTGDSIAASAIYEKMVRSQELIYNTTLFTEVVLVPYFISATNISIHVSVKEKWYIYPTPQFQLVDRNFNEWLKTYNASLKRVIYGVKFIHYNLSGRKDQLRVFVLTGYARNISFIYASPYSNRSLTEGFSVAASITQNREIIYKTSNNNIPLRYTNTGFVRNSFYTGGTYILRKGFYRKHVFSIGYNYQKVEDSITSKYNPAYFNLNKNYTGFTEMGYTYQYVNTNNINYPLTGKIYTLSFAKRGLDFTGGINMFSIEGDYNKYIAHGKNWYSSMQGTTKIKAPFKLAYINQRAMGYGDLYLRGLENYVIDGVATFLAKYTLKKKLIAFIIPVPIKNKIVQKIPITIFAKTYADAGYSYNKAAFSTRLGNRFLYTGGFGLDIITLYDINLKLEYSFNQLGQKGLFLHGKGGF